MTYDELMKLSEKEAFEYGKKIFNAGYSIHYNPYKHLAKLNTLSKAWISGWNSAMAENSKKQDKL